MGAVEPGSDLRGGEQAICHRLLAQLFVAFVGGEMLERDLFAFIPPVGRKRPTLYGTEVDTDGVAGPVLSLVGSPLRQ